MATKVRPPISATTRANRRAEKVALSIIWGAAALTIATLVFILGFIVVRGFYSSGSYEYDVLSPQETAFDGWSLVVNQKIRAKDLPFEEVAGIFSGEYIDWAKLSEQEYELRVLFPSDVSAPQLSGDEGGTLDAYQALGISEADLTPLAELYDSTDEALATVTADPSAAALISSSSATQLPRGLRRMPIRRISIAANPSVMKIVGNDVLRSLDQAKRTKLFSGDVSNWKELGGIDLPISLVLPPKDGPFATALIKDGILPLSLYEKGAAQGADHGAKIVRTGSQEAYIEALKTVEGGAGYLYWSSAKDEHLPIVRAERVENGPNLTLSFLYEKPRMSGRVGGISTIIFNTLLMIVLTILIATPIGVFAAVYLVEYAKQGRLVSILRLGTETLAGIPSIIFGLFGMLFFVNILGWGIGLLSGVLTITIMILPTIVRTSEEALKTVPMSLREGSLALGASKLQTTLKVVVPAASPGILTGIILAVGRAVGETAALVFTMGSSYDSAKSLFSSARVLAVHIYLIVAEGISMDRAFATATILVFIILAVNIGTTKLIGRFNNMSGKS